MNNIKLFEIFSFVYILSIFYVIFFKNSFDIYYKVPRFSSSFKSINGYEWECSEINLLLLFKLYGIHVLTTKYKVNLKTILLYIFLMETLLLITINSSSFVLHPIISILFYLIIRKRNKKI